MLCGVLHQCAARCAAACAPAAAAAAAVQVLPGVLSSFRPQLVLYDAGVDIHADDELGRLSVSDQGRLFLLLLLLLLMLL
jgi:acetoin utilization deacetylase AcuC-like enzyme